MKFQNRLKVQLDTFSRGKVYLNDEELHGVRNIIIEAGVDKIPIATFEMYVTDLDVDIDGELEIDVELEEDEEVVKTA